MSDSESLVDAAIDYVRMGWKILPCWWRPFGKIKPKSPIAELVPNGKDSATCDENLIYYWWKVKPQAMIGGVVPDGKQVLDLDPRDAEIDLHQWLTDTLGVNPDDTLQCLSGNSDGGKHLYSEAHEGRINPERIPAGVDLRDAGKNYCILPPSIHPATGQPYRWNIPDGEKPLDYITDVLGPVWSFLTEPDPPGVYRPSRNGKPTPRQLEGILRRMAEERNKRNIILNWAAWTIGQQGHPEGAYAALFKAAQASGLPDWEIAKTIDSARSALGERQS